jgi:hypothetical protein
MSSANPRAPVPQPVVVNRSVVVIDVLYAHADDVVMVPDGLIPPGQRSARQRN